MANESTAGANEPARKGQGQHEAKGSEQQTRSGVGSSEQREGRGARETSRGLSRRERYEPLATPVFAASPFSFMRRIMDDFDRLFDEFGFRPGEAVTGRRELQGPAPGGAEFRAPEIDVFERDGKLVVRADLPGLSKDDVRVEVDDGDLVIEGERRHEREVEGAGTYREERFYGTFRRVIPLPEGVDPDGAEARFENGVLEVALPMPAERARGKRIEVREGKQTSMH